MKRNLDNFLPRSNSEAQANGSSSVLTRAALVATLVLQACGTSPTDGAEDQDEPVVGLGDAGQFQESDSTLNTEQSNSTAEEEPSEGSSDSEPNWENPLPRGDFGVLIPGNNEAPGYNPGLDQDAQEECPESTLAFRDAATGLILCVPPGLVIEAGTRYITTHAEGERFDTELDLSDRVIGTFFVLNPAHFTPPAEQTAGMVEWQFPENGMEFGAVELIEVYSNPQVRDTFTSFYPGQEDIPSALSEHLNNHYQAHEGTRTIEVTTVDVAIPNDPFLALYTYHLELRHGQICVEGSTDYPTRHARSNNISNCRPLNEICPDENDADCIQRHTGIVHLLPTSGTFNGHPIAVALHANRVEDQSVCYVETNDGTVVNVCLDDDQIRIIAETASTDTMLEHNAQNSPTNPVNQFEIPAQGDK